MDVTTILTTALAGVAVLGVMDRWIRRLYRMCRRLAETIEATHVRTGQLEHNGGSSLRDDVSAIRKLIDGLSSEVDAHGVQIRELQERRRTWL